MGSSGSLKNLIADNQEDIIKYGKTSLKLLNAAHSIHQEISSEEGKIDRELKEGEGSAIRDTALAADDISEEEDKIHRAESLIGEGLDTLNGFVNSLEDEEHTLDEKLSELSDIASRLRDGSKSVGREDVRSIVDTAEEAYSLVEDEIEAEERLATYLVRYSTDLKDAAADIDDLEQDIEGVEAISQEISDLSQSNRLGELVQKEKNEEGEFQNELDMLVEEIKKDDEEIAAMKSEIGHTLEEIESLLDTLNRIETITQSLGYQDMSFRIEKITQSVESEYEKIQDAERKIQKASSEINEAESTAGKVV